MAMLDIMLEKFAARVTELERTVCRQRLALPPFRLTLPPFRLALPPFRLTPAGADQTSGRQSTRAGRR